MIEFETPDDGFVAVFYRHGTQKLSGTAQKTAQKREKTAQKKERPLIKLFKNKKGSMRCLNIAKNREIEMK